MLISAKQPVHPIRDVQPPYLCLHGFSSLCSLLFSAEWAFVPVTALVARPFIALRQRNTLFFFTVNVGAIPP